MKPSRPLLVLICCMTFAARAIAHEVRPAYLEIKQTAADTYDVLWKVPATSDDRRLAIYVLFPLEVQEIGPRRGYFSNMAYIEHWRIQLKGGLDGQVVQIDGLSATKIDVLARIEHTSGVTQTTRILPDAPSFVVEATPSTWGVATTYLRLGIEHILFGPDHLLFVLGLLLIVPNRWVLLKTITSFTVAHSSGNGDGIRFN